MAAVGEIVGGRYRLVRPLSTGPMSRIWLAFDETTDMRALATHLLHFGASESCGKCCPCRIGLRRAHEIGRLDRAIDIGGSARRERADDIVAVGGVDVREGRTGSGIDTVMGGAGTMTLLSALLVALVSPWWLVGSYFFQTVGELSLSPVGLSSMTKLSPRKYVGQMMGIWFTASALGNLIGGLVGGHVDPENLTQMPELFTRTTLSLFIASIILALLAIPIRRMMRSVPASNQ